MSARLDPAKRYAVHAEPAQGQRQAPQPAVKRAALSNGTNGHLIGAHPKTPSPVDPPALVGGVLAAEKDE